MSTRVMVVDDDPVIRALLEDYLKALGYQVCILEGGGACLGELKEFHPDVLLIDFQMPDINGIDLLKLVRATPEGKGLPVVMLSANADTAFHATSSRVEADAYLLKPFDLHEMRDVLERLTGSNSS